MCRLDWIPALVIKDFEVQVAQTHGASANSNLSDMAGQKLFARRNCHPTEIVRTAMGSKYGDARHVINSFNMSDYNPARPWRGCAQAARLMSIAARCIRCETALFTGQEVADHCVKKGAGASEYVSPKPQQSRCQPLSIEHAVAAAGLQRLKL